MSRFTFRPDRLYGFQTEPVAGRPAIVGTVCILTSEEIDRFHRGEKAELAKGKTEVFAWATLIARHVRAWNVDGEDGTPLPITPETVLLIPYPEQTQLREIVTGYQGPYTNPDDPPAAPAA